MEENNHNDEIAMFYKNKRKRHKQVLAIISISFFVLALILLGIYYSLNKKHSINYNETSNIDYIVNLIPNEFYKTNQLGENVDVISSLIKDIDVEFKYNLNLSEEVEYVYNYKIIANIELKEKNKTNLIYSDEQIAVDKQQIEGSSKRIEIVEKMNVSYNDFDNRVKKLIEQYRLDNTESQLSLSMQLNIINKADGQRINKDSNVMTIVIPLDVKTVEITLNENVKDNADELIIQENINENSKNYFILGMIMLILGVLTLISLIKYIIKTRSAEKMYEDELKKILFDYKSYIQKINTQIDYKKYKIIKVNTFTELLQMREEIQSPILMYTEQSNLRTIFMMIKDDLLFTYVLSAKAIRKQLIEESKKRNAVKENENNE